MISQIYLPQRTKIFETIVSSSTLYNSMFLGETEEWAKISDVNNLFTLGGSKETPITYTYYETGVTEFTINICGAVDTNQPYATNAMAVYELFIEGDKTYYYYAYNKKDNIINCTIIVYATKGLKTKFKINMGMSLLFEGRMQRYYFEGHPNIVYSSITAKFIPDFTPIPSSLPIVYLSYSQPINTNTISIFTVGNYSYPLPTVSSVNDIIELKLQGADSYTITQEEGQKISIGNNSTTQGILGNLVCNGSGDWIRLVCTVENKEWIEIGVSGYSFNLT